MKKVCSFAVAVLFAASFAQATLVREKFASDPVLDGWQAYGDTNLFHWNSTNKVLDVTWDSTQTNSYFYIPLDRTYTAADGFYVRFDLKLKDAVAFNSGSQLAIGLLHYIDATNANFSRANFTSPNLVEFDYFPQFSYGTTVYPDSAEASLIDASGLNLFFTEDSNFTLQPGVDYQVEFWHLPGNESIRCDVSTNGQIVTSLPVANSYGPVGAFQLDMLAIISYSDDGFGDSVLAHGSVSDIAFASPLPVGLISTSAKGQIRFASDTNWLYTLQQSSDLANWNAAAPVVTGNGTNLLLQATNPPADHAVYRVNATLP